MDLCDVCKSIPFERLREIGLGSVDSEWPIHDHHSSFDAFAKSAASCALCKLVYTSINSVHKVLSYKTEENIKWHPYFASSASRIKYQGKAAQYGTKASSTAKLQCIQFSLDTLPDFVQAPRLQDFRMSTIVYVSILHDDPLTPQFLHRYMEADAVSDLAFQRVRRWVKTCDESHEVCHNIEKKKWYPSRLIQVEPNTSNYVKLVNCPDGQVAYIALSHCWGSSRTFETTENNIQQHHEGIDIDEIPKTFRDAVIVARQLNVRYLWIDSICIIQDSKHDWFVEASRMDDIYSNASLTISAFCSKNDADGFLRNRPHEPPLIIPYSLSSGQISKVHVQPHIPTTSNRYTTTQHLRDSPTSDRAWTLQEHYLSSRTLYYGSEQMLWTCSHHETGLTETGEEFFDNYNLRYLLGEKTTYYSGNGQLQNMTYNIEGWYSMVIKYTKRALTVPTDKLPALSGLANEYRGRKGRTNTYLAGIWSSTILQGLQWERAERNTVLARPLQYIAPSWSWASVLGPVKYPVLTYFDTFRGTVHLTKLTFHHILPTSLLHPAGEVKNGHLVLETVLIRVFLRQAELPTLTSRTGTGWRSSVYNVDLHLPMPSVHSSKPTYTALDDIIVHANFDFEDEAAALNPAESRIVMLLGRFTEDYGLPVTGLIVEPVPSPLTTFATQAPVSPPPRLDQADIAEQFSTVSIDEKLASQALSYLTGPEEDHAYEDFIELFSELPVCRRVGVMRFSKQETPYQGRNYKKFEVLDQCVRERMIFV